MEEMGTTNHYLTLNLPRHNTQFSVIPLPIRMMNKEIITSTHMALLSKMDLLIEASKAHVFPGLNKALVSIGTFCDYGCHAVFDDKTVIILNIGNGN